MKVCCRQVLKVVLKNSAFSEELTFSTALNMKQISFLVQRQCYLTCTWAVCCRCYINTVKSVLTTRHKPTNNKQMQSSVLELQQCTEAVVISHGRRMLWDMLDIFHVCRETRKLILYTACLLQASELEQILWRRELQAPALTCQATVYFCP